MLTSTHDELLSAFIWDGSQFDKDKWKYLSAQYSYVVPNNIHIQLKSHGPLGLHAAVLNLPTNTELTNDGLASWLELLTNAMQEDPQWSSCNDSKPPVVTVTELLEKAWQLTGYKSLAAAQQSLLSIK